MQEILNELIQVKEIIKRLRAITSNELTEIELTENGITEIFNKIPIPSFEEFSNIRIKRKLILEEKIKKSPLAYRDIFLKELNGLKSINLEEAYLSFIEDRKSLLKNRRSLLSHFQQKHEIIKKRFRQELILKENQEKFLKENLLLVIETVYPEMTNEEYAVKLLKILPKPTEEEYCNAYINIVKLSKRWNEDDKTILITKNRLYVKLNEEELLNIFKKCYQSFINDIIEIKLFYQIAQFKIKQKLREERHTNLVKRAFRNVYEPMPEDELDIEVKSYFKEKQREELISFIVKNKMYEFQDYFEFEFYCNNLPSWLYEDPYGNEIYNDSGWSDDSISEDRYGNIYDDELRNRQKFIDDNCL